MDVVLLEKGTDVTYNDLKDSYKFLLADTLTWQYLLQL